jgi:hypothetical protein
MTRKKAVEISLLLNRIECYEALIDELKSLRTTEEIVQASGINIEDELVAVVQPKIDALLKELEEL